MTRVISGAVLLAFAVAVVWFAPPLVFLVVAELMLVLGARELGALARTSGLTMSPVATVFAVLVCAALAGGLGATGIGASVLATELLLTMGVVLGVMSLATWKGDRSALAAAAVAFLPALYLGLPIGAMASLRQTHGPPALFLLMLTVFTSDIAQYYSGRTFGRRPLAPAVSPKKTIEGAVGGFVFGTLLTVVVGHWWLPQAAPLVRGVMGAAIVAAGIAGDLFESMLKRSAGVKDSSALIPGHGGILDRIDALLFAAPVYYVVLSHL
jgi:phosphatidate cytidylyltransferase